MEIEFRNLTVYKKRFDDFNKRSEEIRRLLNHIPDKLGLKSVYSLIFRLLTADLKMQRIIKLTISNTRH